MTFQNLDSGPGLLHAGAGPRRNDGLFEITLEKERQTMTYTASMSPVGLYASQFIPPAFEARSQGEPAPAQKRVGRALGALGLMLGGAYPGPRVRRMVVLR
jgi:hypothetical protein